MIASLPHEPATHNGETQKKRVSRVPDPPNPLSGKSFLVIFFKKERLAFACLATVILCASWYHCKSGRQRERFYYRMSNATALNPDIPKTAHRARRRSILRPNAGPCANPIATPGKSATPTAARINTAKIRSSRTPASATSKAAATPWPPATPKQQQ